jgi:hypothetical protein
MLEMQLSIDLLLIGRCSAAIVWGVLFAVFLQYNRMGQFIAEKRTWLAVVIGVGADLLLGTGAAWWQLWMIVAFSSIGIIARSLINEHNAPEPALNAYRTKWEMQDAIDFCGDAIGLLTAGLESEEAELRGKASKALAQVYKAQRLITEARYGRKQKRS